MASGAFESQHIAQILDTGIDAKTGSPYTVMEPLVGIPKSGGSPLSFSLQNPQSGPEGIVYFAVDDTSIYYVGLGSGSGTAICARPATPVDGGTQSSVVATIPSSSGLQGSVALAIAGGTLFLFVTNNNETVVASVSTGGGTIATRTTFQGGVVSSPLVDADNIYEVMSANQGPCEIARAPATGGDPSALIQTSFCPYSMATDGHDIYWANASGNSSNNGPMQCTLSVVRAPVTGGSMTTLASITATEVPLQIAVESSNVYVATDQSVWKVPSGGGAARRLAGNLGTSRDNGSCAMSSSGNPVSLAVDGTTVYAAVGGSSRGQKQVLLAIPK
jgi:hypothetical protein